MAFYTGNASNVTDLMTALRNACTTSGWTLAGNVLYKGTCYVSTVVTSSAIVLTGGTGKDGSNNLTGTGPAVNMGKPIWSGDTCTYPVTYHIHVLDSPDEVYMFINYEVNRWQFLAFGQSPAPGISGTGNWVAATLNQATSFKLYITTDGGGATNATVTSAGLFWFNSFNGGCNSFIHHGMDGQAWSGGRLDGSQESLSTTGVTSSWACRDINTTQPNTWNGQTVLSPIDIYWRRATAKVSLVGQLKHSRHTRNDNYDDADVIDLSPDQWRIYPVHQKNVPSRNGGNGISHSGTFAIAVRYDGP